MGIHPPPITNNYYKVQKKLLTAATVVSNASMPRGKEELDESIGIDHSTNCTHLSVSYDGAYSKSKSAKSSSIVSLLQFLRKQVTSLLMNWFVTDVLNAVPINLKPLKMNC